MRKEKSISRLFDTLRILKLIGTPFKETRSAHLDEVGGDLLRYAASNRIHLHFLESLDRDDIHLFNGEFKELSQRYDRVKETLVEVSEALEEKGLDYAFFKTVRPYREVTVDIDIIILDSREKARARKILEEMGLRLLEVGPLSTTLRDVESGVNIDLYEEVGVSHFIYIDKMKLQPFIEKKKVKRNYAVRSLDAVADLLAVVSHSVIKEHIYILSEYFTTIHYLHQMDLRDMDRLLKTVEEWKLKKAFSTHLTITIIIHKAAYGFIPRPLEKLLKKVGYNNREAERIKKRGFNTPYKYHLLTVIDSFIEKLAEPTAKRSLIIQLVKMSNPKFTMSFMKDAFGHLTRKRY